MNKLLVGAATAAHQVEGNNINSDYWKMEHMKYSSFVEPSNDAADHYHRYEEDIRYLAEAGLNAYRFSIEWARIEPKEGTYDEQEILHYKDVLECCKKYKIQPIVTMHHFSSPAWLIEKGGWEDEYVIDKFADYCGYVVKQLGNDMHYVCTINEANMGLQIAAISKRYEMQIRQQAKNSTSENSPESTPQIGLNLEAMMKNMQLQKEEYLELFGTTEPQTFVSSRTENGDQIIMGAHSAARKRMKAVKPNLQIGLSLSLHDIQILPGGEELAKKEWQEEFLHYLPFIEEDDFLGVQNYTRSQIGPDGLAPIPEDAVLTQMNYENYPYALEHVIRAVAKHWKKPIVITENGIATEDDEVRCAFIKTAFDGVKRCIQDGIPVIGYIHWSLLDNFEWQKGYAMKFGLIAVDLETKERKIKKSLYELGDIIKK